MKKINKIVEKFDLFYQYFTFSIGQENKVKSSFFGGLLSTIVVILSGSYFFYLVLLYFQNEIQPKIITNQKIDPKPKKIQIKENFFAFQYLQGATPLSQIEEETNKQYLEYQIKYQQYQPDGSIKENIIPFKPCTNKDLEGKLCLDYSNLNEDVFISQDDDEGTFSYLNLLIFKCQNKPNCASDDEIYDMLYNYQNYLIFYTQIETFDSHIQGLKSYYKSDYVQFDPLSILNCQIGLIMGQTEVSSGAIIQRKQIYYHSASNSIKSFFFSNVNQDKRFDFNGIGQVFFENTQVINQSIIVYPLITEIISQFLSIFNSLLILGIIGRYIAEFKILEGIGELIVKEYYKFTALQLMKNSSKSDKMNSKHIIDNQKKIEQVNIIDHLSEKEQKNLSFKERLRQIFQFQQNPKYEQVINEAKKNIDIHNLFKEILFLKKAIQILLLPDQIAALEFCGCNIFNQSIQLQVQKEQENKINLNIESNNLPEKNVQLVENQGDSIQIKEDPKQILQEPDDSKKSKKKSIFQNFDQKEKSQSRYDLREKSISRNDIREKSYIKNDSKSFYQFSTKNIKSVQGMQQNQNLVNTIKQEEIIMNEQSQIYESQQTLIKNHLQIIYQIQNNEDQKHEMLQKFIDRCMKNEDLSNIDRQIYSCLI